MTTQTLTVPRNIEEILEKLKGVKKISSGWLANCPCLGHETPEGHFTIKDVGDKALVTCFNIHKYEEICKTLGYDSLTYATGDHAANGRQIKKIYDYYDLNGKLVHQTVRFDPKGFSQRQPNPAAGEKWTLDGIEPVIYYLPEIVDAKGHGETIVIVEGEKDVETCWNWGIYATCNPMGAGKWLDRYSDYLIGADIVIIPDNDDPGRDHANKVAKSLTDKAKNIRILTLPESVKDITEWFENGGDRDQFDALLNAAKIYTLNGGGVGGGKSPSNGEAKTLGNVRKRENLTSEIKDWISDTGGTWFTTHDLDSDLGIRDEKDKANRRVVIHELRDKGFLEKHSVNSGKFRYVDAYAEKIDILKADNRPLSLELPFRFHELIKLLPKTLIVCAGAADSGKTAFALNACALNLGRIQIHYFSSEMGSAELRDRLLLFKTPSLEDFAANVDFRERTTDFADCVRPDDFNIVDYLTLTEDFYRVNGLLIRIHEKLRNGLALVLIQKNRGADLGMGGNKGLERPRLYFTMDSGKSKIEKAKNWVDSSNNPNQKELKYKLVNGCKFIVTQDWRKETK